MSRRKPKLQIGSGSLNRNTPDRDNDKNAIKTMNHKSKGGAGLGLLGSYGGDSGDGYSSSEDEDKNLPKSTLDTKVADFLKEIDDIDPKPNNEPAKEGQNEKSDVRNGAKQFDKSSVDWGEWSECFDEHTKHPYYWNTHTDEVTWVMPPEIASQFQPATENSNDQAKEEVEKEANVDDLFAGFMDEINKEMKQVGTNSTEANNRKNENQEVDNEPDKTEGEMNATSLRRVREREDDSDITIPNKRRKSLEQNTDEEEVIEETDVTDKMKIPEKTQFQDQEETTTDTPKDTQIVPNNVPNAPKDDSNSPNITLIKENLQCEEEVTDQEWTAEIEQRLEDIEGKMNRKSPKKIITRSVGVNTYQLIVNEVEFEEKPSNPVPTSHASTQTTLMTTPPIPPQTQDPAIKEEVESMSTTLLQKLEFLDISKSAIMDFHLLLIEIEVRLTDWKAGQLTDMYALSKLQEAELLLQKYEQNAMPKNWACQWDSNHKRYYYMDNKSGKTQWEYPEVDATVDPQNKVGEEEMSSASNENKPADETSSTQPSKPADTDSSKSPKDEPPTPTYPGYNMQNYQYWMMQNQYRMQYPQYMYPDGPPAPPSSDTDAPPLPPTPGSHPPPPPPTEPPEEGEISDDGIEMEISDCEDNQDKTPEPEQQSSPVTEVRGAPVDYSSMVSSETGFNPVATSAPTPGKPPHPSAATGKNKKTKKVKKSGSKKPPKQMVGMVAKWQRAKMQIEEEEKRLIRESEEDLDREVDVKKKIEMWKKDQVMSGKASTNSNFLPIGDDWKKRVKLRKQNIS